MTQALLSRTLLLAVAAAIPMLLAAPSQAADVQGIQQRWSLMDRCTKMARDKYPGTNAETQAKRDAYMQQCQRASRLPQRQGGAPSGSVTAEPEQ